INFRQGFIHVSRTISSGLENRKFIKDGTKTLAGERDVPISKPLETILKQALEEMKDNPEGLIFYDHRRKCIIGTNQVNTVYKRICEKAGVEYNGQHALRHTFATRCIEAGVPALVLKNWLGHTDIHITLDTYADVFDRMNLGAISKFEKLMDEVMTTEN
ncbi:MAG: site-specific integrase, partial [Bacillota bacterium]|nr:site-specific integrase [Bacillota bacterium]